MIKQLRRTSGLTVDEFLAEYAEMEDGNLHELQDGNVVVTPPWGIECAVMRPLICSLIYSHAERTNSRLKAFLGSGIEFSNDTLRGPDLSVFTHAKHYVSRTARIVGIPSLIVEVVGPHKSPLDLIVKSRLYAQQHAAETWWLDVVRREGLFLLRTHDGYQEKRMSSGIFESKVLKGLRLDVAALFAEDKKRIRKTLEGK